MSATLDWINLVVRWIHLTAGIAWIGSSFYFIWLDRHLTAASPPRPRVDGEIWMVHSGGFYRVEKRRIGPGEMPAVLHWFKWEAALTWATGMLLMAVVYYLAGGALLVDPAVSSLSVRQATLLALGILAASWFAYDLLWRSPLGRGRNAAIAVTLSVLLLVIAAFVLFRTLSGRAAYIHVGAILGTLMVANVWGVILPAQQQMIDATRRGEEPVLSLGEQAKRRSVHNSYMTLPVLFLMLSSHFPQIYGHPLGWVILILLSVAGAAARHAMIGGPRRLWALAPMALSVLVVIAMATPRPRAAASGLTGSVSFAEARSVIHARCLPCHSAFPTDDTFRSAPNGMMFDTPQQIQTAAPRIVERAAVQRTMPPGNKTAMTDAERDLLAAWRGGAR